MIGRRQTPPALAVRLLHGCVSPHRREVLLGDLLEKFQEGRSSRWFWTEVLIAILLDTRTRLGTHARAIIFAVIGTFLAVLWSRTDWSRAFWQNATIQSLFGSGVSLPFPLSTAYDISFGVIITRAWLVVVLLAAFWSINGLWSWTSFRNAILLSFLVLAAGRLGLIVLGPPYGYLLDPISIFLALLTSAADRGALPISDTPQST